MIATNALTAEELKFFTSDFIGYVNLYDATEDYVILVDEWRQDWANEPVYASKDGAAHYLFEKDRILIMNRKTREIVIEMAVPMFTAEKLLSNGVLLDLLKLELNEAEIF
jgi:hypothetical protein